MNTMEVIKSTEGEKKDSLGKLVNRWIIKLSQILLMSYLNIFQLYVLSFFTKYKKKNLYLTKMGL